VCLRLIWETGGQVLPPCIWADYTTFHNKNTPLTFVFFSPHIRKQQTDFLELRSITCHVEWHNVTNTCEWCSQLNPSQITSTWLAYRRQPRGIEGWVELRWLTVTHPSSKWAQHTAAQPVHYTNHYSNQSASRTWKNPARVHWSGGKHWTWGIYSTALSWGQTPLKCWHPQRKSGKRGVLGEPFALLQATWGRPWDEKFGATRCWMLERRVHSKLRAKVETCSLLTPNPHSATHRNRTYNQFIQIQCQGTQGQI